MRRHEVVLGLFVLSALSMPTAAHARHYGDADLLTLVGSPGFPENTAISGGIVYTGTPGTPNPISTLGVSYVRGYNLTTGALVSDWAVSGENLSSLHGIFGIAVDSSGRIYANELQGKVLRFDPSTGAQSTYVTLPDLPNCSAVSAGTPCSPTTVDQAPFPNDLVFDAAGNLYITDIFQATIWKVPSGTTTPQIWFQDSRLDGTATANGIRFSPDRTKLYIVNAKPYTATPGVYSLNVVTSRTASDFQLVATYPSGPDGLAVGASGLIYVALPVENAVAVVNPSTGFETHRFIGFAKNGSTLVPFDNPTSVTFVGDGSFIFTNNSITNNPLTTGLINVYARDTGDPLDYPTITP